MAVTITRPAGRRADDVRALRFRFRTLTFSGNYATGGEVISAQSLNLKRILGVIPLDCFITAPNTALGVLPKIDVAADGRTVTIRSIEDQAGASGAVFGAEKNNAEAYIGSSKLDVIVVGEG